MNKSKRVMALGSALVAIAMMAACTAPVPENGAMPTVTPQDSAAQIPDDPDADAQQDSDAPQDAAAPRNGPPDAQGGRMRARGGMMDVSAVEDPDKPAGSPAYSGTVVSIEGDTLTILAASDTADKQASADGNTRPDQNTRANMEQKILTLAAGFKVKKAEFERPDGNRDGKGAPGAAKLTEITREQIAKEDRITVWLDEAGNASYALTMSGMGAGRGEMPPGGRQGERQGRGDGASQ